MTWRVIVISSNAKLDLKMGFMVIRSDEIHKVHLSEISVLIVESTAVSITAMLLCELVRRKIKVIFCDEVHNPYGELGPYYGSHDTSDKLRSQINWEISAKNDVWAEIVRNKIEHQANLAERFDLNRGQVIREFAGAVKSGDLTNREGHAAKVYFNTLFGMSFSRKADNSINAYLNYGYAIILSAINREIAALGYSTQIGIHHDNMFNNFNLGSDLMEPLRPMIDSIVIGFPLEVNIESKHILANILNDTVYIDGKRQYLVNAIRIYVKSVTDAVENHNTELIKFCEYERKSDAPDCVF